MLAHNKLGPIRDERSLKEALAEYERVECEDIPAMRIDARPCGSNKIRGEELETALSVRNLALLGRLLALAALQRTESRGAHFRIDHPDTDDLRWRRVTRLQLGANNAIEFYTDPIKESVASEVRIVEWQFGGARGMDDRLSDCALARSSARPRSKIRPYLS